MKPTSKKVHQALRYAGTQTRRHAGTVLLALLFPVAAWACPLCKEILMEPGKLSETLATAKGYAASILLLLGVPAILVGGVAALVIRAHRRQKHV